MVPCSFVAEKPRALQAGAPGRRGNPPLGKDRAVFLRSVGQLGACAPGVAARVAAGLRRMAGREAGGREFFGASPARRSLRAGRGNGRASSARGLRQPAAKEHARSARHLWRVRYGRRTGPPDARAGAGVAGAVGALRASRRVHAGGGARPGAPPGRSCSVRQLRAQEGFDAALRQRLCGRPAAAHAGGVLRVFLEARRQIRMPGRRAFTLRRKPWGSGAGARVMRNVRPAATLPRRSARPGGEGVRGSGRAGCPRSGAWPGRRRRASPPGRAGR